MPTPVILVDGQAPPPLGLKANGTKADGDTVTLSIASALGIDSIEWRVSKPDGSSAALGSAFPSAPFSTTLGPLAEHETYLITAIANGEADQIAQAAIAVPSAGRGLRTPRSGETSQWDAADGIETDWRALVQAVDSGSGAQSATVTGPGALALSVAQSEADYLDLTGTPGADVGVGFAPSASRPVGTMFVIRNGTDSEQTIADPAASDFTTLGVGAFAIVLWTAGGSLFVVARSDALTAVPPQGFATIAMADANQTPSFSTAANFVLRLTGALTANRNLVLPLTSGRSWYVINDCTGAYSVNVKGATGSAAVVANGSKITVVTDGTNFYL